MTRPAAAAPGRSRPRRWGGPSVLLCALLALATGAPAQHLIVEDQTPPGGVFATFGLGVIDVEAGTGLDIPLGVTAVSPRHRVMASVQLLDFGLLQGTDRDLRYQRYYSSSLGGEFCFDSATGSITSYGRCAGNTDVLRSLAVDVNVLPVETVIVGSKPGSLHAGVGLRFDDPRTVYGTIGMFFPSRTGKAAAVRLSMGRRYIFLGFSWGFDVRRALSLL